MARSGEDGSIPNTSQAALTCGSPEDVGGTVGYEDLLEAIHNPNHPQHEGYLEWIGDNFDPEAFDAEKVNRKLLQVK